VVSAVSAVSPAAGGSLMMELVEPAKIHKKMRRNVRNVGKDIEKNGNIVEKCCSC
jgi:predicted polyphosphate/ATP-dependent NAD kinase